MPLVVDGVTRFSVNGARSLGAGDPVVNIIDLLIDTTGTTLSRADANFAAAGNIINSWCEHVLPLVSDQYQFQSVSWVDLDSALGDVGQRTQTSLRTLPDNGNIVSEAIPANAAVLVSKDASTQRGQRNGRMYVFGAPQTSVSNNTLSTTPLAAWQAAFDDLLAEVNDEPITPVNFDRSWVVVHTIGPNPQVGTQSTVTALSVQNLLATQRRRLR